MNFFRLLSKALIIALAFILPSTLYGQDEASTGLWNNSGTWTSGTTPASNDHLVIPAGVTVSVNCNCGTYSGMTIDVYGTLNFPGGKKINLTSDGVVNVYPGGTITGSNNGDKININGTSVWSGSEPDITGPTTCEGGGCATNTTLPIELQSFSIDREVNQLIINWTSATELNNDFYSIEISYDYAHWTEVARINGAGTKNEETNYLHTLAEKEFTESFYLRLTQTDLDGTKTELVEDYVSLSKNALPSFYPSPASDVIYFKELDDVQRIEMTSLAGQTWSYPISSSDLILGIENEMKDGIYFVRFIGKTGDVLSSKKLLVFKN